MLDTTDHAIFRSAVAEQVELWLERHTTTPTTAVSAGNDRTGEAPCPR